MIIFGTRGLTLNKGKPGEFFCPGCNGRRPYQRKKIQRFFTLYFIPLIPMNIVQEHIQCLTCKRNYRPEVLQQDPTAQREAQQVQLNENIRALLIHFARMSARHDAVFAGAVAGQFQSLTGASLATDQVAADLAADPLDVAAATERLAPMLNDRGREAVMVALIRLAGPIDPAKQAALDQTARTLGMTDAHYHGVLALPRADLPAAAEEAAA